VRSVGYFAKLFARWTSVTLSVSLLLFLAAGSTQLSSLRYYLVTFSALLFATMFSIDPGLVEERSRPVEKATTPGRFAAGLWFLATLVFAALDIGRLHQFDSVSGDVRMGSLLLFGAATTLQLWAMVINPFFSPEIRLQSERGHQLVACGPYRFLRHPGYLAMLISAPASGLAIGSWLALVPAAAFCLVILKRVRAEEEFLQKNLAGYRDYMRQVRGRLFPRIAARHPPHRLSVATKFKLPGSDRRWP
jgi:protein-S-isoprenylcysteine O-methyltransferase Ste14